MLENLLKINIRQHEPHLSDFLDQILAATIQPEQIQLIENPVPQKIAAISPDLVEPLSDRELEVLRLLREEPEYEEIARKLVLSTNTIKTHIKHIYGKLGVSNRREALLRAKVLHLLQP